MKIRQLHTQGPYIAEHVAHAWCGLRLREWLDRVDSFLLEWFRRVMR